MGLAHSSEYPDIGVLRGSMALSDGVIVAGRGSRRLGAQGRGEPALSLRSSDACREPGRSYVSWKIGILRAETSMYVHMKLEGWLQSTVMTAAGYDQGRGRLPQAEAVCSIGYEIGG